MSKDTIRNMLLVISLLVGVFGVTLSVQTVTYNAKLQAELQDKIRTLDIVGTQLKESIEYSVAIQNELKKANTQIEVANGVNKDLDKKYKEIHKRYKELIKLALQLDKRKKLAEKKLEACSI